MGQYRLKEQKQWFPSKMDLLPLQCHFDKFPAILKRLETRVLLQHDIVLEILAAEVEEVDSGFGEITDIQDTLDGLQLAAQDGVLVPPLVIWLAFLLGLLLAIGDTGP